MKHLLLLLLPLFAACQPSEVEKQNAVVNYYKQQSLAAGGGNYSKVEVKLVSTTPEGDSAYLVTVVVTGTYSNGSIANDPEPRPFKNKRIFVIAKREKSWEVIETR